MMVRTNPLPAGRYWIWIAADKESVWLKYRVNHFGVLMIESESATHEGYGWNETRSGTTYIFTTTAPIPWLAGVGFPNTAPAELKTADTIQRPQVPTLADDVRRIATEAQEAANTLVTVVVVGVLIWALTKRR